MVILTIELNCSKFQSTMSLLHAPSRERCERSGAGVVYGSAPLRLIRFFWNVAGGHFVMVDNCHFGGIECEGSCLSLRHCDAKLQTEKIKKNCLSFELFQLAADFLLNEFLLNEDTALWCCVGLFCPLPTHTAKSQ